MDKRQNNWDKIFKNKHGQIVVWQNPNLPLWMWLACSLAATMFEDGVSHRFFDTLSFAAIVVWAYLELTQGANYFRRGLGFVILLMAISSRI